MISNQNGNIIGSQEVFIAILIALLQSSHSNESDFLKDNSVHTCFLVISFLNQNKFQNSENNLQRLHLIWVSLTLLLIVPSAPGTSTSLSSPSIAFYRTFTLTSMFFSQFLNGSFPHFSYFNAQISLYPNQHTYTPTPITISLSCFIYFFIALTSTWHSIFVFIIYLLSLDCMLHECICVKITVFSVPIIVPGSYMMLNDCRLNKSLNHTTSAATFFTTHVVMLRNRVNWVQQVFFAVATMTWPLHILLFNPHLL